MCVYIYLQTEGVFIDSTPDMCTPLTPLPLCFFFLAITRQTYAHCLHHCRSDRYVQLVTVQIDNAPDIFSEVKFSLFSLV